MHEVLQSKYRLRYVSANAVPQAQIQLLLQVSVTWLYRMFLLPSGGVQNASVRRGRNYRQRSVPYLCVPRPQLHDSGGACPSLTCARAQARCSRPQGVQGSSQLKSPVACPKALPAGVAQA